jgi:hypothetical protein
MEDLTINSLKFHSNMLSSSKENLKIKTRWDKNEIVLLIILGG